MALCFQDWVKKALRSIRSDTEATREAVGMINARLDLILERQELSMSKIDDLKAAFDEATSAIAARIERIIAGQDAAVVAALQPELDRLRALGADPANPVPPVPVEPPAPVEPPVEPSA